MVKSTDCSSSGPGFDSQHWGASVTLTAVLENPVPLTSASSTRHTRVIDAVKALQLEAPVFPHSSCLPPGRKTGGGGASSSGEGWRRAGGGSGNIDRPAVPTPVIASSQITRLAGVPLHGNRENSLTATPAFDTE